MIKINKAFHDVFLDDAKKQTTTKIEIGRSYTAVMTSNGDLGLSHTSVEHMDALTASRIVVEYENKSSEKLLECIFSQNTLKRSAAVALINALNRKNALSLDEDPHNEILHDFLGFTDPSRKGKIKTAMVGYIPPLAAFIKDGNGKLEVVDKGKGLGSTEEFLKKIDEWADVLVITATTLLNETLKDFFSTERKRIKTVLLGPTTPMVADVFKDYPVNMLAGFAPTNTDEILASVQKGYGTRSFKPHGKKVYLKL